MEAISVPVSATIESQCQAETKLLELSLPGTSGALGSLEGRAVGTPPTRWVCMGWGSGGCWSSLPSPTFTRLSSPHRAPKVFESLVTRPFVFFSRSFFSSCDPGRSPQGLGVRVIWRWHCPEKKFQPFPQIHFWRGGPMGPPDGLNPRMSTA